MFCKHFFPKRRLHSSRYFTQYYRMTAQWKNIKYIIEPYAIPKWAQTLKEFPQSRIKVAHLPTHVHMWNLSDIPTDTNVFIKRDDLTGSSLSGNKIRKLEFIFAEAIRTGCKHVITCGGIQSNHCRATAVLATELGLKCHLFLRGDITETKDASCHGNMFFNRMCGADIYYIPRKSPYETKIKPRMEALAQKMLRETGEKCYLMPVGGSDKIGFYGYLEAYHELIEQEMLDHVTDIVFTCGSGGTAEGLAAANYLATDCKLGIHGIAVSDDAKYFHNHCNTIFNEVGLDAKSEDLLHIIEGHKGQGYGITTEEDLEFIARVSRETGIILDPTYTGKAARGLVHELNNNPQQFKGNQILFIHTGGMFGAMDGSLIPAMTQQQGGKHYMWPEQDRHPWS